MPKRSPVLDWMLHSVPVVALTLAMVLTMHASWWLSGLLVVSSFGIGALTMQLDRATRSLRRDHSHES